MYQYIRDPGSNRIIDIRSKIGKKIVNRYFSLIKGGSGRKGTKKTTSKEMISGKDAANLLALISEQEKQEKQVKVEEPKSFGAPNQQGIKIQEAQIISPMAMLVKITEDHPRLKPPQEHSSISALDKYNTSIDGELKLHGLTHEDDLQIENEEDEALKSGNTIRLMVLDRPQRKELNMTEEQYLLIRDGMLTFSRIYQPSFQKAKKAQGKKMMILYSVLPFIFEKHITNFVNNWFDKYWKGMGVLKSENYVWLGRFIKSKLTIENVRWHVYFFIELSRAVKMTFYDLLLEVEDRKKSFKIIFQTLNKDLGEFPNDETNLRDYLKSDFYLNDQLKETLLTLLALSIMYEYFIVLQTEQSFATVEQFLSDQGVDLKVINDPDKVSEDRADAIGKELIKDEQLIKDTKEAEQKAVKDKEIIELDKEEKRLEKEAEVQNILNDIIEDSIAIGNENDTLKLKNQIQITLNECNHIKKDIEILIAEQTVESIKVLKTKRDKKKLLSDFTLKFLDEYDIELNRIKLKIEEYWHKMVQEKIKQNTEGSDTNTMLSLPLWDSIDHEFINFNIEQLDRFIEMSDQNLRRRLEEMRKILETISDINTKEFDSELIKELEDNKEFVEEQEALINLSFQPARGQKDTTILPLSQKNVHDADLFQLVTKIFSYPGSDYPQENIVLIDGANFLSDRNIEHYKREYSIWNNRLPTQVKEGIRTFYVVIKEESVKHIFRKLKGKIEQRFHKIYGKITNIFGIQEGHLRLILLIIHVKNYKISPNNSISGKYKIDPVDGRHKKFCKVYKSDGSLIADESHEVCGYDDMLVRAMSEWDTSGSFGIMKNTRKLLTGETKGKLGDLLDTSLAEFLFNTFFKDGDLDFKVSIYEQDRTENPDIASKSYPSEIKF